MLEITAIYLSAFVTKWALKNAFMYPVVGVWRATLGKLGLPVALIEAEILTTGVLCATNIVKRHIDALRKPKPKK